MNKTVTTIIIAVVVAAASFWAGTFYQTWQSRAGFRQGMVRMGGQMPDGRQFGGPGGQGGFGRQGGGSSGMGGPGGERLISGRLDKADDGELTLTTRFGSVKVKLDDKAKIKQTGKADSADLKTGKQVIINAETDDEGKLSAKSVVIE